MTENDEQMLIRFFEENKLEIADDGFTGRVARQLPSKVGKLNRIWSVICWVFGIALFFMMDGIGQMYRVAILLFYDVVNMFASVNLSICSVVMLFVLLCTMISVKMYQMAVELFFLKNQTFLAECDDYFSRLNRFSVGI